MQIEFNFVTEEIMPDNLKEFSYYQILFPGSILPLYAETTDPISKLKDLIAKPSNIPSAKMDLLYEQAPLTRSLKEEGVPFGATIDVRVLPVLNVRLPDGKSRRIVEGCTLCSSPGCCTHREKMVITHAVFFLMHVFSSFVCAGEIIPVDPPLTALVDEVKPLVQSKTGIASETQQFKFKGTLLEDKKILSVQGIGVNSIIDLEIKPGIIVTLSDGKYNFL